MWIVANNAFLSIVDPGGQGPKGDNLLVRARIKGDLERCFPKAKVFHTPTRDYAYRAFIPRKQVAEVISRMILDTAYTNFKSSVHEDMRHSAYARVWGVMFSLQNQLNGKTIAQVEATQARGRQRSPLFPDDEFDR